MVIQASVLAVGVVWVVGLLAAGALLQRCGVADRSSRWALACIVTTGGLIAAVHMTGLAWLVSGIGLVTPPLIAAVYPVILYAIVWLMRRMIGRRTAGDGCPIPPGVGEGQGEWGPPPFASPMTAQPVSGPSLRRRSVIPSGRWWLPVIVVGSTYCVFLIDAVTRYPTGWDGIHYHLPMAVRWLQDRTIDIVPTDVHQSYPNNGMIPAFLLLACGFQRLTSLVSLPQAVLLALLVYAIGGQLGMGRLGRLISTCVVMSIPIVVYQTFSAYVDLFGTTAWLGSLLALMWATRIQRAGPRRCLILVGGLACGIAVGSKLTYIAVAGALVLIAGALPWIGRLSTGRRLQSAFRTAALFGLAASACSGFWFVRNVVRTGNPVFPLGLTIAGVPIVNGVDPASFFPERTLGGQLRKWWSYPWLERRGTGYNYGVGNGMGAAFAPFVPLGFLGCMFSSHGWRTPRRTGRWRIVCLLLVCLGMGMFMTILYQTMRFALPMIVLSVPCAGVVVERVARRRPLTILGLLTFSLAVTGMVAVLPPGKQLLGRVRDNVWARAEFYEIPPMINDLPAGCTIANVSLSSQTKNFALLGDDLGNRVIGPTQWEQVLGGQVPSRAILADLGVDYLFVAGGAWADWPADLNVEQVYDSSTTGDRVGGEPVRIYRVLDEDQNDLAGHLVHTTLSNPPTRPVP